MPRSQVLLVSLIAVVVIGCGFSEAIRPAAPNFRTIGQVRAVSEGANETMYTLADGQVWKQPNGQFRVAYDMSGEKTLFISGVDDQGTYVLLVGSQQGLPGDCTYALRYGGREWGDAIESQGFVWTKAAGFRGLASTPTVGAEYPGYTVLCLDDLAQVASVVEAAPVDSGVAPAQSATAP